MEHDPPTPSESTAQLGTKSATDSEGSPVAARNACRDGDGVNMDTGARRSHSSRDNKDAGRSSTALWWKGVALGAVVGLPIAWLLSYGGLLPFLLGLFFFCLFGLVVGATTVRVASAGRPYGRTTILLGTTLLVLQIWCLSIWWESRSLPADMFTQAKQKLALKLDGRSLEACRADVEQNVRIYLQEEYPPGGIIGYLRWLLLSGEIKAGSIDGVKKTLDRGHGTTGTAIRLVVSMALLAFGVASQTLALKRHGEVKPPPPDEPQTTSSASPRDVKSDDG